MHVERIHLLRRKRRSEDGYSGGNLKNKKDPNRIPGRRYHWRPRSEGSGQEPEIAFEPSPDYFPSGFIAFRARKTARASSWASLISVLRKYGMIETPLRTKSFVTAGARSVR